MSSNLGRGWRKTVTKMARKRNEQQQYGEYWLSIIERAIAEEKRFWRFGVALACKVILTVIVSAIGGWECFFLLEKQTFGSMVALIVIFIALGCLLYQVQLGLGNRKLGWLLKVPLQLIDWRYCNSWIMTIMATTMMLMSYKGLIFVPCLLVVIEAIVLWFALCQDYLALIEAELAGELAIAQRNQLTE